MHTVFLFGSFGRPNCKRECNITIDLMKRLYVNWIELDGVLFWTSVVMNLEVP